VQCTSCTSKYATESILYIQEGLTWKKMILLKFSCDKNCENYMINK